MKEIIEQLANARVYGYLDLWKAFHQGKRISKAEEKLVLATEFGKYQYNVMPFGLKNISATFAKVICIAFSKLAEMAVSYFDNIMPMVKDVRLPLSHLKSIFEVIKKYNLTL